VILFLVVGSVLQNYVDWDKTMPTAALAGVVIALLIPDSKSSCAIPSKGAKKEENPSPTESDPGLKVEV
jgi:hypothetical protein